jgi:hypothetical protein
MADQVVFVVTVAGWLVTLAAVVAFDRIRRRWVPQGLHHSTLLTVDRVAADG